MQFTFQQVLNTNDRTIIDTCTILNKGFIRLIRSGITAITDSKKSISIPYQVLNELNRLGADSSGQEALAAREMLCKINRLHNSHVVQYIGDKYDSTHADERVLEYILQNRSHEQIAVITQDTGLSFDLLAMNSLESFEGRRVSVYRIDKRGNIIPFIRKDGSKMFIENAPEQVWLDKEAIMSAGLKPFMRRYIQAQEETITPVVIHAAVINEIEKISNEFYAAEAAHVENVLELLHNLKEKELMKMMGNPKEPFDSAMQYINAFIRNRIKFRIVFISNNKKLAQDFMSLNELTSFDGHPAQVKYLKPDGTTEEYANIEPDESIGIDETPEERNDRLLRSLGI